MFYQKRSPTALTELEIKNAAEAAKEKTPEELRLEKLEKKAAEMKQKATAERLEQLEYYKFPNIMGWYFDGTFTKDFTLHEEYAEYFNEIEEELDAQKDLKIEETFTEKAFRYFWPPDYVCGTKYFRTRGVYLDFKEVKEDPPKTPPNINYEKNRGLIGVEVPKDHVHEEDEDTTKSIVHVQAYGIMGWRNNRDNWYWSDTRRDFKPKEPDGDYIWANDEKIWVEADPTYRTPYDWYFDESLGKFFIRDRSNPDLYVFDKEKNIYLLKDAKGPSANGLRKNDFYYDERQRKWFPISTASDTVTYYNAGYREIIKGDRGESGLTPDDFYYDGITGKMHQKDPAEYAEYYYDTRDKMWKKKGQPYGPGEANHYPTDYEFDLKMGVYYPKHARECKHLEPNDFYFDLHEGKFHRMDGNQRDNYVYDADNHLFYLKGSEPPSVNGLSPDDYFWNENERNWQLVVTLKDPATMLDYHDAGKRKTLRGDRGRSGKVPDDFYYDAIDGSFFRKDVKNLTQYWFDPHDMVWKKRGQGYGPGYFRLYPEHYYFDYEEGYYFPTTTAKHLLAKLKSGEVKGVNDKTPYDYAFNDLDGYFQPRDRDFARHAKYKKETGVFHVDIPVGIAEPKHGKAPKDFFFDEYTATWLPIEHPKGIDARYYKHGRRNNRQGPRGKSGKIPDDYYFDFDTGEFLTKAIHEAGPEQYDYLPDLGVWRSNVEGDGDTTNPYEFKDGVKRPKDYYFDKEEGKFILKSKLKYGEIYLNPFTNLWMQRWRCPQDYYWEPKQQKYLRKPASMTGDGLGTGTGYGGVRMTMAQIEAQREAELEQSAKFRRDYERPWLHNFLVQAADEIRFEQELLKAQNREVGEAKLYGIEKGERKDINKPKPIAPELDNETPLPPHQRHSLKFEDEEEEKAEKLGSLASQVSHSESTKQKDEPTSAEVSETKPKKTKSDKKLKENEGSDEKKTKKTKSDKKLKEKEGSDKKKAKKTKSDKKAISADELRAEYIAKHTKSNKSVP